MRNARAWTPPKGEVDARATATAAALPPRMLVVWCEDWPVVAAGIASATPAAVIHANRVVACSAGARAEGVGVGLRRREAQARCPDLVVVEPDPARDARAFEPVVSALEALTPRIEVVHPGCAAIATRGPSRYHGGDHALAGKAAGLVASVLPGSVPGVGVADGLAAATLAAQSGRAAATLGAARQASPALRPAQGASVTVVPPGQSASFLAPFPITRLGFPELSGVLVRLGIRTVGDLAELPAPGVVGRFGAEGARAHRLARGLDPRPPNARPPAPDWSTAAELDPPADRVDAVAFVAKSLADELHARLSAEGLACTRVLVIAETEHGERHERLWRTEGAGGVALTPGAIADRVRWQLDGWLNAGMWGSRPTAGISTLRLSPDEVVPATGRQLGFWGGAAEAGERAARALARVEGLLGPGAALVAERRGGRGPGEQVALVPAGAVDLTATRPATAAGWVTEPWPGQVPTPSPALVLDEPVAAEVLDGEGLAVRVSGRGEVSAEPVTVAVGGGPAADVAAWVGPWPADERWWDPAAHRRRARLQVVTADGVARLLIVESGRWWLEATYD